MTDRHSTPLQSSLVVALDFDSLASVMPYVTEKSTLYALMRTCRRLYREGIIHMVEWRAWKDALTPADLRSFHEFMTRRAPASFNALHMLDVSSFDFRILSSDESRLLEDLVKRGAPHLIALDYPDLGDPYETPESLLWTFSSFSNLRSLKHFHQRSETLIYDILTSLHSPLTEIDVWLDEVDVVQLFSNFASTLQSIKIAGGLAETTNVCYRNVTKLEAREMTLPNLDVLSTVFPSLDNLSWDDDSKYLYLYDEAWDELQERMEQNADFQAYHCVWASLKILRSNPMSLYALGLKHEVEEVVVHDDLYDIDDLETLIHASLAPLQPGYLDVGLEADEDLIVTGLRAVSGKLARLKLMVGFMEDVNAFDSIPLYWTDWHLVGLLCGN
ncbi:hypothetical protein EIP86_003659 [Pleurotus ostreatoroseus]|nr:hypothetical protein EIP86_003659 [Pleurotus ostreatoroseus]